MNFKLTFIPDKSYYNEAYNEIVSSLKYKKYEPLFAVIMICIGIILYFKDVNKVLGIFPIIFSLIGIYELFKLFFEKKKWITDRINSKIIGQQIEMEFSEENIKHSGPFSNGLLNWNGLHNIVKTKNGILIKPENGTSIYLQDKIFNNKEEIEFIISQKKKTIT